MKILMLLLSTIFLFSCNAEETILQPPVNASKGHWELHFTGDLQGNATVLVRQNGMIDNSIIAEVVSLDIDLKFNIDCTVKNYTLTGNIFVSVPMQDSTLHIEAGNITGQLANNTGIGEYNVVIKDQAMPYYNWQGSFTMDKL